MKALAEEKEKIEKLFETMLSSDEIVRLSKKNREIQKDIDVLEEKWFSLSEILEE